MTLDEMIMDYAYRAPTRLTVNQIHQVITDNYILVEEDVFIAFGIFLDEIHILFPYAARGKSILPLYYRLAAAAKQAGFKRMELTTNRPKAVNRLIKGLKPVGITFVKELS
ncbi:MAG: hypothetical protein H6Q74_2176 [Firmicutes bacterium]|nr:hypothetical protein [Bacillota bacterium]